MCEFKSAIVMKDGKEKGGFKLLLSPWSESHSELFKIFKIKDDGARLNFARVEFSPDSMVNAHLLEKYKLNIDESRTPEWFSDAMKEKVAERMAAYIKSILVTGDVELITGGQFIVAPWAKVECAQHMILTAVLSGGIVQSVWSGGTVQSVLSGAIIDGEKSKGTK